MATINVMGVATGAGLLERSDELACLHRALAGARDGRGSLVALHGAPGLGASSLLTVGAGAAREAGMVVLSARADSLGHDIPFGLARRLIAPLFEDRADHDRLLAGDGAAARPLVAGCWSHSLDAEAGIREGLCSIIAAASRTEAGGGRQPLALVLDALQWADRPTVRFLLALVTRLDNLPVTVLCARDTEPQGQCADLFDLIEDDRASVVATLRPLSIDGVATLARRVLGEQVGDDLARECARVTGGYPAYLGEVLHELDQADPLHLTAGAVGSTVPAAVVRSVTVRLARLPGPATAVAHALAVLGDRCDLALVARLTGLENGDADAGSDALAGAGLIETAEPLRFVPPIVGAAVYDGMSPFARARLHRRAADLLIGDGAPADRVATQLLRARPQGDAEAAAVLRVAAAAAQSQAEPRQAVALLERALAEHPPDELRAAILVDLAGADVRSGSAGAGARLEEALALLGDPVDRARTLHAHAAVLHHAGDFEGAASACERGLALLPGDHPFADQLRAGLIGSGLLCPPLLARARQELQRLLDAGALPVHVPALCAQLAIFCAEWGEPDERVRTIAAEAFARDPLIDGDPMGVSLGYAAQALIWVDALDEAAPLLDAAAKAAQQRGAFMALAIARLNQATVAFHQGRLAEAVDHAERALEVHEHGWTDGTWSTPVLAMAHLERGDLVAARSAVALGEQASPARSDRGMLLEARAHLALVAGDPEAALADALAVGDLIEHDFQSRCARLFRWPVVAAMAAHRLGRRSEAVALADAALAEARELATPRHLGEALTVAGLVAGDADGLALHEEAVAVLETSPSRLQLAHSLLELGSALRRRRRRAEARDPLAHALELADELGAAPLARRARHELGLLGVRPRRSARTGRASLTPGQLAVAELAAAGHGNVEIARRLFIARKTVESHLSSAYRKLGIQRRDELAEAFRGDP